MSDTFKDRIARALDEAATQARDIAKSLRLRPATPRLTPAPVPIRPRK